MTIPVVTAAKMAAALEKFDTDLRALPEWAGWEENQAYRYAIRSRGKLYPVKKIVSMAAGMPLSTFSGGSEANAVAESAGLAVEPLDRDGEKTAPNIYDKLQNLALEDEEIERLEDGLSEVNFFEAIGAVRSELRHSDFLQFLLDPTRNHGLGDLVLKRIAQRATMNARAVGSVTALELSVCDLEDTKVFREADGIDLLLISEANKLAIVIENKIDSVEHSDQLARYLKIVRTRFPDFRHLFVFLTKEGDEASDANYVSISHGDICEIVENLIHRRAASLYPDIAVLLKHYTRLIRRHFMEDGDLVRLARQIYSKHKVALDYIFENRPDFSNSVRERLETMIASRAELVPDTTTYRWIRFAPVGWRHDQFMLGDGTWTSSRSLLLFEFQNASNQVKLALLIGPGDKAIRQDLLDFAIHHQPPFSVSGMTLNDKWNQIWSERFLSAQDLADEDLDTVTKKLDARWKQFLMQSLPAISSAIEAWSANHSRAQA